MICASPGVLINACSHGKKESACWVLQIKTIKKKSQVLVKFYIFKKPQIKKKTRCDLHRVFFFNKKEAKL